MKPQTEKPLATFTLVEGANAVMFNDGLGFEHKLTLVQLGWPAQLSETFPERLRTTLGEAMSDPKVVIPVWVAGRLGDFLAKAKFEEGK